jgi:hypothetical protein
MTKRGNKETSFIPPSTHDLVPELERDDRKFEDDVAAWYSEWERSHGYGPAFVQWCKDVINDTRETLAKLFFRYGIQPSTILHRLSSNKYFFLTHEQLETGKWIGDVPDWYYGQTRTGTLDSRQSKILRNKKLVERNAQRVEKARQVLTEMPIYILALGAMPDPFSFPDKLKAIAKTIRDSSVKQRHRPQLRAARIVMSDLVSEFQRATGHPLYEYAGILTKSCFPDEWNPAGDIREAAKKLISSQKRIEAASLKQQERYVEMVGLPKLDAFASLIRTKRVRTVGDLVKKVPELAEYVASLRRLDQLSKSTTVPARSVRQLQAIITHLSQPRKRPATVWARLSSFMKRTIAHSPGQWPPSSSQIP